MPTASNSGTTVPLDELLDVVRAARALLEKLRETPVGDVDRLLFKEASALSTALTNLDRAN